MAKPPARGKSRPPRTPLPTLECDIDHINDDGVGIGRHAGKEVVVAGAFAGERVEVTAEHTGQRRIIGRLRKVLSPNPDRVPSPCRHARSCLGCPLIAMDYAAQLGFKQDRVRQALDGYPDLRKVPVAPAWEASHPLGYRTNAKLVCSRGRGQVKIGLYRRGSHDPVDIGDCPLHNPLVNRIVAVVREEIDRQKIYVYDPARRRGLLRYLAVRVAPAANKAMVTFVVAERDFRPVTHLAKWLKKKVPEVVSVNMNVNASEGNVIFGRETKRIMGVPDLIDQVGDVRLRISPTSFFQVNNEQAARIYRLVRQWAALGKDETALDLYCGIGGIALHLAKDAGRVIGVEVAEEAVGNARTNARLNDTAGCSFFAGDAAGQLEELAEQIPPGGVAVVNPPRSGCEPQVLKGLAGLAPRTLIYVSCNPRTLARDLDILGGLGYRTAEVQPVDMFPQTGHVESVARLVPA